MITWENQWNRPFQSKNLKRIWPSYSQGKKIHYDRMKDFTIDLTLNLLLPLIVLAHTTTGSSESTDSSILNLLYTNTHVCDFEISLKGFKSPIVVNLICNNFYNTGSWVSSKNIAGRRRKRVSGTKNLDLQSKV